jgi:hypothetical protein
MESHVRRDKEGGCGNQDQNLISTGAAAFTGAVAAPAMMGGGMAGQTAGVRMQPVTPSHLLLVDDDDDEM